MMDEAKRKQLEAEGWVIGDVKDFLGLSDDEMKAVDQEVRNRREAARPTCVYVVMTGGDYEESYVYAVMFGPPDLRQDDLRKEWRQAHPGKRISRKAFCEWLVEAKGFTEQNYQEWAI